MFFNVNKVRLPPKNALTSYQYGTKAMRHFYTKGRITIVQGLDMAWQRD